LRSILGFLSFLLAAVWHPASPYVYEFARAVIYERVWHMMAPHVSVAVPGLFQYGPTFGLVAIGLAFFWPGRPAALRWKPVRTFLERDAATDQYGIQHFSGIAYIQLTIETTVPLTSCRAWSTRVEFTPDGIVPYAIEHNERRALPWSQHGGSSHFEADLNPTEPPVRINVAVFDDTCLQFDPTIKTPENLFHKLQRVGFHRVHIALSAMRGNKSISHSTRLIIHWRGPKLGAIVTEDKQ
jgi:hypothetical protein